MGLFDRFKAGTGDKKGKAKSGAAAKWADRVERRVQNYDRAEAIQALSELETVDAVEVLLKRFTFHIDPSITDQEEKDAAFRGILRAGPQAIEPIRAFSAKAESLSWPMKLMKELVGENEYVEELLRWLSRWDTEYAKFVDPKVQLLVELEGHPHPKVGAAVQPFLDDVNEPARFHAVATLFAQDDAAHAAVLINLMLEDESVRVRTKIAESLLAKGWTIPDDRRDAVRKALPVGLVVSAQGQVLKR